MAYRPSEIQRLPERLLIKWRGGGKSEYSYSLLRKVCPCARCQAARTDKNALRVLPSDQFYKGLKIIDIQPVGHYAIRLIWNDGHRTGIYTYEFLYSLEEDAMSGGRNKE
jgi:DUF971 family protein